ncbi:DUF2268 domain-containing putative Zn-dependent protease [uncultured Brevibacillus sp.]|uniref:DUF2268 domain-containing putative Zn-dependent protease n=1 Tax=uncultured Brevibacillus sp. TaxID=169970 RepID=UPI0025939AC7|nr:DUF2268 domain-containing putative Zn-dependent protease [uncultured Brevibacillus sp.]
MIQVSSCALFMKRWSLSIILVAVFILSSACTYDKPVEEAKNSPFATDSFTIDRDGHEEQAGNRKIIEQHLHSTNYPLVQRIMFGGDELPLSFGYSEGYQMVQAFINSHPSLSVEQWTAATPAEIYQLPK